MRVRIVAFATAAEALGSRELELELPEGANVAALRRSLEADHPGVAGLWSRLAVAVDGRIVDADVELAEGVEVALLPPVSGGVDTDPDLSQRVRLVDEAIESEALQREVAHPSCGAVVVFLGNARDHHQGRKVEGLTYDAYRSMALRALERIVREIEADSDSVRLGIVHRLGEVPIGESSVAIAAAAPHRAAAYDASRLVLERLKREVPIWKREHYSDGSSSWREEEALAAPASE